MTASVRRRRSWRCYLCGYLMPRRKFQVAKRCERCHAWSTELV